MKKLLNTICFLALLILITGCEKKLMCEEGYTLKENSCYKELESKDATEVYTCEEGYTLNSDNNKCIKTEILEANKEYSCNNGYTLTGDKCFGVSTINATPTYSCPNGGTLNGSKCVQRVADLQALTYRYYCIMGTLSGTKCISSPAPITGRCPAGSVQISGDRCSSNALKEYSCLRGEQIGSMCYIDVATSADVSYSCQSGYTLNGTSCSKNVTVNANINYTCADDYSLIDNTCQKTFEIERTLNYQCDKNYELKENKCILYDIKKAVEK